MTPPDVRLRQLLEQAQKALASCQTTYSEYNQFEGDWNQSFSEPEVYAALCALNQELELPAPKPFP